MPRTRHLHADGTPRYTNHLAGQTSPYLLQHLHNPVDWWPWGDDAFVEARRRDVPVFLSVGYATCHWCHVMEDESFEDEDIAALMNARYVCIKLDREERPDVDAVYMQALQALTGRGGWPMSVWLTPEAREPFYAGTYFPPYDGRRGQRLGFHTVLTRLADTWRDDRAQITTSAAALTKELVASLAPPAPGEAPGLDVVDGIVAAASARFDHVHGGVGAAPKFPSSTPLRALLRHSARTGHAAGREMALHTLTKMIDGGLFDQLGGGFHRYSTDERWHVPHYEKMLYDNALLVPALLDAFQLTGEARFATAATQTLSFVDDVLSSPDGAFCAATDADSRTPTGAREEGFYFTWSASELRTELDAAGFALDDQQLIAAAWNLSLRDGVGTVDDSDRSLPWRKEPMSSLAPRLRRSVDEIEAVLDRARTTLLRARSERPAPLVDTKVIAAHNGLAIAAFARAGLVLDDDRCTARAVRAFDAVCARLRDDDGRLWRTGDRVHGRRPGLLDDHAALCRAALELFETTGLLRFLDVAVDLDRVLQAHFEDRARGGFYVSADDGEALLAREKPDRDGAEPSGNSLHVENLVRLGLFTEDRRYQDRADKALRAFGTLLRNTPHVLAEMSAALELDEAGREIVVVVPEVVDDEGRRLLEVLRSRYVPARVLVWSAGIGGELWQRVPLARDRPALVVDGVAKVTVYVCAGGACQLPVTTSRALLEVLAQRV
ncbi:MAG TPA: thioredoxin domain-containing protein [Myxococcota bacterium]